MYEIVCKKRRRCTSPFSRIPKKAVVVVKMTPPPTRAKVKHNHDLTSRSNNLNVLDYLNLNLLPLKCIISAFLHFNDVLLNNMMIVGGKSSFVNLRFGRMR